MSRVLAYAETRGDRIRDVAEETVTAARRLADQLGADLDVLVAGPPGIGGDAEALATFGADRLLVAEDEGLSAYAPDALVGALEDRLEAEDYAAVLFPASARGKDLAPRVAARVGRSLATEVVEIGVEDGHPVVVRPQYAGKALARVAFTERPALISIRPNIFLPEEDPRDAEVRELEIDAGPGRHRISQVETGDREKLDVSEASIVVSGGRGMQDPENWHLLEELADALGDGVALGASRAVVDAGWRPHEEQVGQTGKVVTPELYFAVGISGAIQHLAGMRTSKVIVAVNKDPEAPIFEVADYGIVGDLFEVLPPLTEKIREVRGS
jgi:electron transfer flavoprotein alpha subunit